MAILIENTQPRVQTRHSVWRGVIFKELVLRLIKKNNIPALKRSIQGRQALVTFQCEVCLNLTVFVLYAFVVCVNDGSTVWFKLRIHCSGAIQHMLQQASPCRILLSVCVLGQCCGRNKLAATAWNIVQYPSADVC